MKKAPLTAEHQARRRAALERFSIDATRAAQDPEYKARKEAELASLKARLGISGNADLGFTELKAAA